MPIVVEQVEGNEKTVRATIGEFREGRYTATFPHEIPDGALFVADNVVYNFDALVSKRPGNAFYGFGGGGLGTTGSGVKSLAGYRFYRYPAGTAAPQLLVQSGGKIYTGNDATGVFTPIIAGISAAKRVSFDQMRDPDMSSGNAVAAFICDDTQIPQLWDGANNVPVHTGGYAAVGSVPAGNYLPVNQYTTNPITPRFCCVWQNHMVYSGDPNDPSAIWISDAARPERFNGFSLTDSGGITYTPYYPGGQDGAFGPVTSISVLGPFLIIKFFGGIVSAINTGTYSATQYQFATISARTGMPSPFGFVAFEGFELFFGGDQFYALNGEQVIPMPIRITDVYGQGNSNSVFPPEMKVKTTVIGSRRGTQAWFSYDAVGAGSQTIVAMFDTSANGGYSFGAKEGGAWARWPTGMPVSWMIECRGAGDAYQCFWGSSLGDLIAQHDVGTYDDFGAPITVEIRAKALFLNKYVSPKTVQDLYIVGVYQTQGSSYTDSLTGYCVLDISQSVAPATQTMPIQPSGIPYGALPYGTFNYGPSSAIIEQSTKTYPQQERIGNAVQPGVIESSKNPFNLIAFVLTLTTDNPMP